MENLVDIMDDDFPQWNIAAKKKKHNSSGFRNRSSWFNSYNFGSAASMLHGVPNESGNRWMNQWESRWSTQTSFLFIDKRSPFKKGDNMWQLLDTVHYSYSSKHLLRLYFYVFGVFFWGLNTFSDGIWSTRDCLLLLIHGCQCQSPLSCLHSVSNA